MPIYEYRCDSCGRVFEVIQKFSDEPLQVDPECGKGPVERLISAPSFQFKGTGFYITDYNKGKDGGAKTSSPSNGGESKSETKSADSGSSDSKSTESKSSESKSSESKPAPAAEAKPAPSKDKPST
ncbi:MAG: zinc ribbon domain-containing protein [Bryobacteraceae bacterium]